MERDKEHGALHSLLIAAAVCIVCSVLVSSAAVLLRPKQASNVRADRQRRVLLVAGLLKAGERPDSAALHRLFEQRIRPRYVELSTGRYVTEKVAEQQHTRPAAPNKALITEIPRYATVYQAMTEGEVRRLILPIEGMGLWSTLHGYLALDTDGQTVRGITFYQHGETAGLGGEVDDPRWQALWDGRKVFDDEGRVRLRVKKGHAGPPAEDPYHVDGLSGATLTGDGVSNMLEFWLGPDAFGPYLRRAGAMKG